MVLVIITFPMIIFQKNITVWYIFIGFLTFCSAFLYITRIIRQNRLFWAFCPLLSLLPLFSFIYRDFRRFASFSPFHAFSQHFSFIYRIFRRPDRLLRPFLSLHLITRVFMWNALFHPFLLKFHYIACFYGFSACFPLFIDVSTVFTALSPDFWVLL